MKVVDVENEVVAFAVAPGTGDAEAEAGGFEGEGEFREFSTALGAGVVLASGELVEAAGRSARATRSAGLGGFSAGRLAAFARRPVASHK